MVGRPLTAANIAWNPIMKDFEVQWKAIMNKKSDDPPETPSISGTTVMKWNESFVDVLHRCIGARDVPLAHVIHEEATVPAAVPALMAGKPHSEEHGSVEAEMIARCSHTHPTYRTDNESVYFKLEEATRGTTYAATIKPSQRTKNGRQAYLALVSQHAGNDKWHGVIKKFDNYLHTVKWKGQSNYTLDKDTACW
jgi:hypothetical protein